MNCKKGDDKILQAKILFQTYVIEKGLSLKNPRPGFVNEKVNELMALHYKGIATIPLHWGVEKRTNAKLHEVVGISRLEAVIMLIGIGNYPDEFNVAKSCRRSIDDVCVII